MAGITDKISGKVKQAAGDLADDPSRRAEPGGASTVHVSRLGLGWGQSGYHAGN
jgi:hypothetical protein